MESAAAQPRSIVAGLGIERLTRGQKYTAGIAISLVAALLTLGRPDAESEEIAGFAGGAISPPRTITAARPGSAATASTPSAPEVPLPEAATQLSTSYPTPEPTVEPSPSAQSSPSEEPSPSDQGSAPPSEDPADPSPIQPILDLVGGG